MVGLVSSCDMRMERMEGKRFVWLLSGPIFHDPKFFSISRLWILKATLWRRYHSTAKEWPGSGGTLNNSEQYATLTNSGYE